MSGCSNEASPCCRAFALRVLQGVCEALPDVAQRLGPDLHAWVDRAAGASAAGGQATLALHGCSLHFRHSCRHSACTDPACQLCKNNPHKACAAQLRPKYVVGQEVAAPCGAPTTVTLGVGSSGAAAAAAQQWAALAEQGTRLQVLLVDERARQQKAKELLLTGASSASSSQVATLLRDSVVAFDPTGRPMLSCQDVQAGEDGSLLLDLKADGSPCVALSGLTVGCSTERATAGRKRAPVRLAALLVDAEGQTLDVAPVLSPEFYVVSDRSENHEGMGGMLRNDSPVAQVRSIGKETVRRLLDLPAACSLVGVDLDLPEGLTSVTTVGELAQLLAATKEHATDLSQVLKLSKSQLETAAAHVATAVEPDTWLRVFLAPSGAGLLYSCDQGGCTLGEPAAVLECRRDDGGSLLPLAVQRLGPNPPELRRKESTLQQLVAQAEAAWHTSAHPGWEVLQLGGNCFESFEELKQALPADLLQPVVPRLPRLLACAPTPAQSAAEAQAWPVPQRGVQQAQQGRQDSPQPSGVPQLPSRRRARRSRSRQQQKQQQGGEQGAERLAAGQRDDQQQQEAQPPPLQQPEARQERPASASVQPPQQAGRQAGGTSFGAPAQPQAAHGSLSAPAANPFAVAASAPSSGSPSKRAHLSGSSGPLSPGAQQGSALKRPKLADAVGQEGSGTAAHAERPSLESNNSRQGPLFVLPTPQQPAALQPAWAPLAQQQQQQQQQQRGAWPLQLPHWQQRSAQRSGQQQADRPTNPMPSVPRPPTSARSVDEQQQAHLLVDLMRKLSKEQGDAGAAGLAPSSALSWDWLESLGGSLAAAPPAQPAAGGPPAAAPPAAAPPTAAAAAPPAHPLASLGLAPGQPLASLFPGSAQLLPGSELAAAAHPDVGQQVMERLGSLGLGLNSAGSLDFWSKSIEALAQLLATEDGQAAGRQPSFPPGAR